MHWVALGCIGMHWVALGCTGVHWDALGSMVVHWGGVLTCGCPPPVFPPAVLCPLLCQNGGVCARPDSCLCPPHFTGRFCHLPHPLTPPIAPIDPPLSMVSVHVQHPPEASVTIHHVERVRGGAQGGAPPPPPPNGAQSPPTPPRPRGPPGVPQWGGGCVRAMLPGDEGGSPLPGLRTQDICCRGGAGVAWGVHECEPCAGETRGGGVLDAPCPPGFQLQNGSCEDVDECGRGGFCRNGICTNTRGSFACLCPPGFLLDASRSSCISQQVLSEARGPCFRVLRSGRCALPTLRNITRQICCCSRVGKAWGGVLPGFKEICPAGPGYHYSASDLRFNARYLGQDLPRVPLGRPRTSTAAPPATREDPPPPPPPAPPIPPPPQPHKAPSSPPIPHQPHAGTVCERNPQLCGPGRCVPHRGGYSCRCHPGFWLSTQGTHCIGEHPSAPPMHPLPRAPIGPFTLCCGHPSFSLYPYLPASIPIPPSPFPHPHVDECRRSPRPCTHGRCENTVGSYRCLCHAGYQPSAADVDECAQSPPPCTHGRCENLPGSYRCLCPTGYRAAAPGEPCQVGALFHRGTMQWGCPAMGSPHHGGPHTLSPPHPPIDIDECENEAACPGQECLNTAGSFQCRPCRGGFRPHRGRCTGPGPPRTPASIDNINECLEGDFCFPHGECLNTEGSFTCLCAQGFTRTAAGTACIDIDECQRGVLCAGGLCVNTDGSFECRCPPGFRTDAEQAQCHDVDECREYGGSLCGAQRCENEPGSYRCVSECQPGYRRDRGGHCVGEHRAWAPGMGTAPPPEGSIPPTSDWVPPHLPPPDVDECSHNGTLCGAHASCLNLPGSFQCACDPGYETAPHGHHCVDVNECESLRGVCGSERCENADGSFLCLCPDGGHEFDPVTGRCVAPPPSAGPAPFPAAGPAPFPRGLGGSGGGLGAHGPSCPTEDHDALCPHGPGRAEDTEGDPVGEWGPHRPPLPPHYLIAPNTPLPPLPSLPHCPHCSHYLITPITPIAPLIPFPPLPHCPIVVPDVDECSLFTPLLCRGGVCVNAAPGFSCYCPSGFYYEPEHLQCVDNDECSAAESEPCVGGLCTNTVGSFHCSCPPPLVLDASQRRCVHNDSSLEAAQDVCWQEVGADLVCARPRVHAPMTYSECCCRYGQAWGMECALCPAPGSDDFELLCNVLRPPSYGPPLPPPAYEYAPDFAPPFGLPFGFFGGPPHAPPPFFRPDYDPYGIGGAGGGGRGGVRVRGSPRPPPPRPTAGGDPAMSPPPAPPGPCSPTGTPPGGIWGSPAAPAADPAQCAVLSGCHHGRCVRVPDGFTCACDRGFRLDPARLDCVDVDECALGAPCRPGGCINTPGSFRCLCPPGHAPAPRPPPRAACARPPPSPRA
uniref:Uncharacterized protein n=1 Tax=Melopsittacus undulatus TaxID=13146 RepID=A0A8V5GQH2_MELUD